MQSPIKKVCVVGAGAGGLTAVRWLRHYGFEVMAFEQTTAVGGTWVYDEKSEGDIDLKTIDKPLEKRKFIHSSMYQNLHTNLEKESMAYSDLDFATFSEKTFPSHFEVHKYLKAYSEEYNLNQYIQFRSHVKTITPPNPGAAGEPWKVEVVRSMASGWGSGEVEPEGGDKDVTETHEFDAVVMANGHYFVPYIPPFKGVESFPGRLLHSHNYRKPDEFAGKTVVVIGTSASGLDIAKDISKVCKTVYICQRKAPSPIPEVPEGGTDFPNVYGRPTIAEVFADGTVTFEGRPDEKPQVDTLLYCTGYQYSYPQLPENYVKVDNGYVTPLYEQLLHIHNPTIAFLGLPWAVLPFPLMEVQSRVLGRWWSQAEGARLPSFDEMKEWHKEDMERVDALPRRYGHRLFDQQFPYCERLAAAAGDTTIVQGFMERGTSREEMWAERLSTRSVAFAKLLYANWTNVPQA
eukprot:GFYU01003919.1.p1 GENE.GFYU01003919.1~~GFYU01003919.1.p1  ORF type:complete len:462 (+),score=100.57 GFYU01003919.1:64-1449(+)